MSQVDGEAIAVDPDAMEHVPLLCASSVLTPAVLAEPLRASPAFATLVARLLERDALYEDLDRSDLQTTDE